MKMSHPRTMTIEEYKKIEDQILSGTRKGISVIEEIIQRFDPKPDNEEVWLFIKLIVWVTLWGVAKRFNEANNS